MKRVVTMLAAMVFAAGMYAQQLTILHTNDTHSHIDPVRSGAEAGLGGVIERAAYVDSVRNADGRRNVLLVDAGDFSQGTSYFTMMHGDVEVALATMSLTTGLKNSQDGSLTLIARWCVPTTSSTARHWAGSCPRVQSSGVPA